ncbi:hypothetical protein NPIL_189511 [Nephila pilipes]|uniref:Uncharacterized protein n=1 Tax=Nephila pilipes TaxID=299642 RepID=A0A8X6IWQ2_NEPPI|nr:hypothetical protein NPIL_189511 [Nephila pilipes]
MTAYTKVDNPIPLARASSESAVKRPRNDPARSIRIHHLADPFCAIFPREDGPTSQSARVKLSASYRSSTFRAKLYPEVTDRNCRLSLSKLFYRLEAVHLGDLLRDGLA